MYLSWKRQALDKESGWCARRTFWRILQRGSDVVMFFPFNPGEKMSAFHLVVSGDDLSIALS